MPRFLLSNGVQFRNRESNFEKNVAIRTGTSLNLVLKFQVYIVHVSTEKRSQRKVGKWKMEEEEEEEEKKKKKKKKE